MNEELGRHSDRDGRVQCTLCGAECESVVHVLWECSTYSTCRDIFQKALKQLLGARYAEFERLISTVEKRCARWQKLGGQLRRFVAFSEGVHRSRMGSLKTKFIR